MKRLPRVLVAEDDVASLELLRVTLDRLGYDVTACCNGTEALEKYQTEFYPIVISDWHMPEMDGLDFCRGVREHGKELKLYTYFILLTAESSSWENYEKAMKAGVDDFMSKPMDRPLLRARLHVAGRILSFNREMRHMQELMTICCYSKKVLNEKKEWEPIEGYFERTLGMHFSHGISPEAYEKIVLPQLEELKDNECC